MASGNVLANRFRPYRMKSRQILLLTALEEHGTLRRAAAAIHTTQPAATALLQQLEDDLGVILFERHTRGMRPTPYGDVMIRYAHGVVHDFEHAINEMDAFACGASGLVRVGSVTGAIPIILTGALARFKIDNPRVQISLHADTSDLLIPELVRGNLDVVLGRLPDQFNDDNLNIELLEAEPMSIVARTGHPLFALPKVKMSDLIGLTWILHPAESPMRRQVESALKVANLVNSLDTLETASLVATTALLEQTDMISVIPKDVAQHYANYKVLGIVPLELPLTMAQLGIITRKQKGPSPATMVFLRCLRDSLANTSKSDSKPF